MAATGLSVFDQTLQKSNVWINDLAQELGWDDKHQTFQGLRIVLHVLRDRLTVEEASQLGAQLPVLLAGFYYEDWKPGNKPTKERSKEEFLAPIRDYYQGINPDIDVERLTQAVFKLLADKVTRGEIRDVVSILPPELKALWPEAVAA